jgi:CO/xanthine dehydrogenase Mo-binding subunit
LNAIQNATGLDLREIPATPEVLMEAMTEKVGARG